MNAQDPFTGDPVTEHGDLIRGDHTYSPVMPWLRTDHPKWLEIVYCNLLMLVVAAVVGWLFTAVPVVLIAKYYWVVDRNNDAQSALIYGISTILAFAVLWLVFWWSTLRYD